MVGKFTYAHAKKKQKFIIKLFIFIYFLTRYTYAVFKLLSHDFYKQ